jgi:Zn-finger nucleic acid-binding protein
MMFNDKITGHSMPLLTSPIDGSPMRQIHRFGIELDVCASTGGVWLDKGELEKLITFIKDSAEEDARHSTQSRQSGHISDDDDYHRPKAHYKYNDDDYRKGHYKKKSGMNKIMDIFDF